MHFAIYTSKTTTLPSGDQGDRHHTTATMVRLTFDPDGDVLFTLSISKPASEESDNKSSDKDLADGSQSERPTKRQKTLPQNEEANEQQDLNIENDLEAEECVTEFLVSSSHLKLASKMFRSMLQPHFVEGQALRDSGNVTILLFDDDTAALNVVMKIVHAQSKDLPTEMDSKLLAQVATIVDKYQLQDCVGYFAQEWIKRLTLVQKISSNKAELQSYLCIAWVFKAQSLFAQTTLHAIKHAKKHTLRELSMATVPIPKAVIGMFRKLFTLLSETNHEIFQRDLKRSESVASKKCLRLWKKLSKNTRLIAKFIVQIQRSYSRCMLLKNLIHAIL